MNFIAEASPAFCASLVRSNVPVRFRSAVVNVVQDCAEHVSVFAHLTCRNFATVILLADNPVRHVR